jgi:hypothetical protein
MVVHWYTVTQLSASEDIAFSQMQFILKWYTGTLSHNFVPQRLLSQTKVNLIHGGTLVHCHTTQYLSTHCLQPNAIYIAVVHWYTVTQLCFPVPTVSKQSQFYSWWYTGIPSQNSVLLLAGSSVLRSTKLCDNVPVYHHELNWLWFETVGTGEQSRVTVYQCTTPM